MGWPGVDPSTLNSSNKLGEHQPLTFVIIPHLNYFYVPFIPLYIESRENIIITLYKISLSPRDTSSALVEQPIKSYKCTMSNISQSNRTTTFRPSQSQQKFKWNSQEILRNIFLFHKQKPHKHSQVIDCCLCVLPWHISSKETTLKLLTREVFKHVNMLHI